MGYKICFITSYLQAKQTEMNKKYYRTYYILILVILFGCSSNFEAVNEKQDIEKQIELIPTSQSLKLTNNMDLTKTYDSILEIKIGFGFRKIYNLSKSYSVFPNIIHIDIDFSSEQLSENKERSSIIKELLFLDFTSYKNLKAITITCFDKEFLEVLVKKMAELPKIELLTLNLNPSSHLFWDKENKVTELYALPDDFCLLKINTLKITGKRSNFANPYQLFSYTIPFYTSITLPDCFTNELQVSRIIYEQDIPEKLKEKDFKQFRLHKKNKTSIDSSIVINQKGFYELKTKQTKTLHAKENSQLTHNKVVESIDSYTAFIQQLLKVKSAEEIILMNAFVDSIPNSIGELKKLKELSILNGEVSYFPKSIRSLNELETIKILNNSTDVYFDKEVYGLKKLKNIAIINTGLSNGFPDFLEAEKIEKLIFLDKNTVDKMPSFLNNQQSLKTLIWRYTNIDKVLDGLNNITPNVVNIDNNKVTQIDNILNMAEKASYFSYDINNISFEKREAYNSRIYPSGLLQESANLKKKIDALYEIRAIPFVIKENIYIREYSGKQNTVINKFNRINEYTSVRRSDLKKDKLFKAIKNEERYGTVSFKVGAEGYKVFSEKELKELESYFDLIEEYKLEPLHIFKYNNYNGLDSLERIPIEEFTTKNVEKMGSYIANYNGYEYLDYSNRSVKGNFDYGKLRHLRKASVANQEELKNIAKVKGLRFLEIKNIEKIKNIPECFCELKELDSIYVRDSKRDKFKNEYVDIRDEILGSKSIQSLESFRKKVEQIEDFTQAEKKEKIKEFIESEALRKEMKVFRDRTLFEYKHIKIPDCMKEMKFKQVTYSGMVEK